MTEEQVYRARLERIRQAMDLDGVETLVLFKPQNTFYVTNFNAVLYSRPVIVVVPRDKKPSLIIPRLRWDHAKEESRVRDIHVYQMISMSLTSGKIAADPLLLLRDILEKQNALRKRIGIEKDYLTLDMFGSFQTALPEVDLVDIAPAFRRLQLVKDAEELEMIRRAAEISDVGLESALASMKEGVTEIEVSLCAMEAMNRYWEMKYPDSEVYGFGDREGGTLYSLWCYCIPGKGLYGCDCPSSRKLRRGDNPFVVVLATVNGYHCENERTPMIGEPTLEQRRVFEAHFEATRKITEAIKPGVTFAQAAKEGARVYEEYGYAECTSARGGHSIGLSSHEGPSLAMGENTVFQVNMVLSVEPSVTVDGLHVGHSNVGVVTEKGFELLTKYRVNELIVL